MDLVPDAGQLSQMMSQATAPAFILEGSRGSFPSCFGRITNVIDRIRTLNGCPQRPGRHGSLGPWSDAIPFGRVTS